MQQLYWKNGFAAFFRQKLDTMYSRTSKQKRKWYGMLAGFTLLWNFLFEKTKWLSQKKEKTKI